MMENMTNFDGQYAALGKKAYRMVEVEEKTFFVDSNYENIYKVMGQNTNLKGNQSTVPVARVINDETITKVVSFARVENNEEGVPMNFMDETNNESIDDTLLEDSFNF